MSYEKHADYGKQWLLPPSLEDWVGADHPARMVREFVDAVDLEGLGFKARKSEAGRPSYSANLLAKAWLYGYMRKVRSCRGLEQFCQESMGMIWLMGLESPDHTTLWRFWKDNQEGLRKLFKQLLQIAAGMNLIGMVLHAVDGTKIQAQSSPSEGLHATRLKGKLARLDEAIEEILKQTAEAGDQQPPTQLPQNLTDRRQLRDKIAQQLELLKEKGEEHFQPGEPEARVMKTREGNRFAYNAQAVVDHGSQLIVAADVVDEESDNQQLVPMIEQVEQNLGNAAEHTVGDAGYFEVMGLAEAEEKNFSVVVNMADSVKGTGEEPYHAAHFVFDAEKDHCVCPQGQVLTFERTKKRDDKTKPYAVRVYRCRNYETCPVRWQCSDSKTGRTVQIHPRHDVLMRHRQKLRDETMRALLRKRSQTVEPIFGWLKQGLGFRRWTFRGKQKVRTQWIFLCTTLNLRRLHPYWIEKKLVFA